MPERKYKTLTFREIASDRELIAVVTRHHTYDTLDLDEIIAETTLSLLERGVRQPDKRVPPYTAVKYAMLDSMRKLSLLHHVDESLSEFDTTDGLDATTEQEPSETEMAEAIQDAEDEAEYRAWKRSVDKQWAGNVWSAHALNSSPPGGLLISGGLGL
jgi:hypothetical protein